MDLLLILLMLIALHGIEEIRNHVMKIAECSWLILLSFCVPLFRLVGLHSYDFCTPDTERLPRGKMRP